MAEKAKRSIFNAAISSRLVERYLFNFRVAPDILASRIPVRWLKPRVVNGWGVVSFCILRLEHVMLKPLPSLLGFSTTSCAYRCSVIDTSGKRPEPSVYIPGRSTDLALVSRFGPAVFSGAMPVIHTGIAHTPCSVDITASYLGGRSMFSAKVRPGIPEKMGSQLFGSFDELADFIKGGVSSYTPSTRENLYSRVDLEENSTYEPVDAAIDYGCLDAAWRDSGLVFDSAMRAKDGCYNLTYMGRVPAQQPGNPLALAS